MNLDQLTATKNRLFGSVLWRIFFLAFLILILQIPVVAIDGLTTDREDTRQSAVNEVSTGWGGEQRLSGPIIAVPYRYTIFDKDNRAMVETRYAYFLPNKLDVKGSVATEKRYRGIFEIPVYRSQLTFSGTFSRPDFSLWETIRADDVLWKASALVFGVSDAKGIKDAMTLAFGVAKIPFGPGKGALPFGPGGVNASVGEVLAKAAKGSELAFSFDVNLNGSANIFFQPDGGETTVALAGDWPDPSFQGAFLPTTREISAKGFQATWHIPNLGRTYPQQWLAALPGVNGAGAEINDFGQNAFGVNFLAPVDAYRMTRRAVKYEFMFVLLTFLAFFLFEIFNRLRIHPVQYLLVGSALCIFYLLVLSLAEHLGFNVAYLAATAAVVLLVTGYCTTILAKRSRGGIIAGILAGLYVFLYVLLVRQDDSLLLGSLGLFAILSVVMFITRKIDWYDVNGTGKGA